MAVSVIQSSLTAGEISRNLFARVDLEKYHSGAALMRNWFVDYRGGASTRAGTEFLGRTLGQGYSPRLIPFIFSQQQAYVLEFGDFYMRVWFEGAQVVNPATSITNITRALPAVVTSTAHGLTTSQDVILSGVGGMSQVNGKTYRVGVLDANNFYLADLDGNLIDSTAFTPYTSGGQVASIYQLVSPYSYIDLRKLKFVQSADVMTFTHPNYAVHNLSRTGPSTFAFSTVTIGPLLPAPAIGAATPNSPGDLTYQYIVCAVTPNGERGTPSAILSADSAALNPTPTAGPPVNIEITYSPVAGADHYDIFKSGPTYNLSPLPTYFGYVASTNIVAWTDSNIAPDYSNGPPQFRDPFSGGKNPGCVTYYQQRRVFGNIALSSPEQMEFSKTGDYANFDTSFSVLDSDAISIAIASRQVNEIKSMVPTASGLIVLTTGGGFLVDGGSATAALTPSNIVALPQASTGANDLPPIQVNYDILFVQNKGAIVRDLTFQWQTQSFYGFDRSTLSSHLFFGQQLTEWAWAEEPFKIVWAVRGDGRLLSLTYVPEQEIYGWAQHDTQGLFDSVCSVPEGDEDRVYFVVERQFGAEKVWYVERMASRHIFRVEDSWSVDCALAHGLTSPTFGLFVNANPTTAFLQADTGTPFDSTWLGQIIWFGHEVGGGKMRVSTITSVNQIVCDVLEPLGNVFPGTDPAEYYQVQGGLWEYGPEVTTLSGLDHLAGQSVECVADGESVGPLVVSAGGTITIPQPASKIVAGLKFLPQLQTLDLDTGDPTIQGRRKLIPALTLRLDTTRGLSVGGFFTSLIPLQYQPAGAYTPPIPLFSGDMRKAIPGGWTKPGQMCVQQNDPYPATVLGIIAEVVLGDTET